MLQHSQTATSSVAMLLTRTLDKTRLTRCLAHFLSPHRCEDIVVGEPAELLVLSQDDSFTSFKVTYLEGLAVALVITTQLQCQALVNIGRVQLLVRPVLPSRCSTSQSGTDSRVLHASMVPRLPHQQL
jgi:hypothetical protein